MNKTLKNITTVLKKIPNYNKLLNKIDIELKFGYQFMEYINSRVN
jgi:hypothetical protein